MPATPIAYRTLTAPALVAAGQAAGVQFVHGEYLLRRRADGAQCACAVGQLALACGYVPEFRFDGPGEPVLVESFADLYDWLRARGVPAAFIHGLDNGYETGSPGRELRASMPDEDLTDYALGCRRGLELRALVAEEAFDCAAWYADEED